jgi:anti-sigma B factor antagonist
MLMWILPARGSGIKNRTTTSPSHGAHLNSANIYEMSAPGKRLHVEIIDGGISVAGEIDAHTCPDLAAALEPLRGSGDVRIDMAGVQFIDSSGLRVLIGAHQRAAAAKRKLLIDRPSKSVLRIIEISGLADHLQIADPA